MALPNNLGGQSNDLDLSLTGLREVDLSVAGRTALLEDRIDDAIRILKQAVAEQPEDFQSHNWLGIAYSRNRLYEEAIQSLGHAVRLSPANERYWYNLGTAYQAWGLPQHAARYFQVALRLAPDYDRAAQALTTLQVMNPSLPLALDQEPFAARTPSQLLSQLEAELVHIEELPTSVPYATVPVLEQTPGQQPMDSAGDGLLSIDLAISEQPTARFPGTGTRLTAALIDIAVIQVIWIIVVIAINAIEQLIPALPNVSNGVPILLGAVLGTAYVIVMTAREGQTVGKQVMRVQVVDRHGHAPSASRAILRTISVGLGLGLAAVLAYVTGRFASSDVAAAAGVVVAGLWYAYLGFDRRRQTAHDKIAGTYVIGRRLDTSSASLWLVVLGAANLLLCRFLYVQLLS